MLEALEIESGVSDFLAAVVCEGANHECYLGLCSDCPNDKFINSCFSSKNDEEEVEYLSWQHTDSTDIKKVTSSLEIFIEDFVEYVPKILTHHYLSTQQQKFITSLREDFLKHENAITVQVDYAQNYTFVVQKSVQVRHKN